MKNDERNTKIIDLVKTNFKGYYLIEGTPSPDLIATIATRYLVDIKKMDLIAYVESPNIIPIIRITKGIIEHPIRIYANRKYKLLVLLSDQTIDTKQTYNYAKTLVDWCMQKKVKGIISLVGTMPSESKRGVYFANNKIAKKDLFKQHNFPILEKGLISGPTAQISILADKIESYILLANPGKNTNFNSAADILEAIETIFKIDIDTNPLEDEAKKIIASLKERMNQMEQQTKEENKSQMTFV